jgi:hypothetical protein
MSGKMKLWLVFGKSPYAAPELGYGAAICVREREAQHVVDHAEPDVDTTIVPVDVELPDEVGHMLNAYLRSTRRETDELELPGDPGEARGGEPRPERN